MNKKLINVILAMVMVFMVAGMVYALCTETDGGDDPFNFGVTSCGGANYTDQCFIPGVGPVNECYWPGSQCSLKEWWCDGNSTLKFSIYGEVQHCLNGEAV